MKYRGVGLLSMGHMFTDINQGAIPALLPFFITEYHLSYTAAASIVFAANVASSLVQPLFGFLSDRWSRTWLMPVGILLAGTGLGLSGWVHSYPLMLLMVAISGLGVSAFHPEAAKLANRLAQHNKATGLSIFAVGGNAGFAFGPLVATGALLLWGPKGTIVFLFASLIAAAVLYFQFKDIQPVQTGERKLPADEAAPKKDQWSPFFRLSGVVVARSILFFGLNTFIPLYWISVLNESAAVGGTALTVLFSAGIFATLAGGRLADKYGHRRIMVGGWAVLVPLVFLLTYVQSTFWATALLLPISFGLFSIYGPMMVTGQNYLPNRVGFASGITIGLAVSIGGVTAPFLGWIADLSGVQAAMQWLVIIPVLAVALTLTLPQDKTAKACSS
jgi:FSR family fosmidomycin resistance protein-like MFS transporter